MPHRSAQSDRATRAPCPLRATARLQLHAGFGFAQATAVVEYYQRLGISHFYVSPILTARPGSTHGYDVVDATRINPELGGEAGLHGLCASLHAHGMGLIVDIVPNHMAVGQHNAWWQDVLRWGRASRHAHWFDIAWDGHDPALHGKVLLPFLAQPYAQALQQGELILRLDASTGQLYVAHGEHRFPLHPPDHALVLKTAGSVRLTQVIAAFERIDTGAAERYQQAAHAQQQLAALAQDDQALADIDAALAAFSANQPHGCGALHQLLERQHYRLSHWRNAADEINWRRFFEVSELVGMRVECDEVFEAMHAEIFRLYAAGLIDGLRLDHIDGLADPAAYCLRLRERLRALRPEREPYLIAEKILAADEILPPDWQLDGTTGYEFMDQCAAVLHDEAGEPLLDALWREIIGSESDPALNDFGLIVQQARRGFLTRNFAAEFNALTHCLHALARSAPQTRDLSLMSIRRCMAELLVHFPVYRSYASARGMPAADRERLAATVQRAAMALSGADHATLHVIEGWLGGDLLLGAHEERRRSLQLRAITRWQQLTPPLTAKSSEDTAFYRYGRLLSRNEVGAEPARLALSVAQFHRHAGQRAARYPATLLATATHDHKRGEDARMRLAALSEIAAEWTTVLRHWRQRNAPLVAATAGAQGGIDALDEAILYQTLVGVWPQDPGSGTDAAETLASLATRVVEWQRKALREGKRRSDWVAPQAEYEAACERFVRALLSDPGAPPQRHAFLAELQRFVQRLAPLGVLNSLTQTMLKLCAPGVPDLYQGGELWDLSLVDPDNRRPVDFAWRQRLLLQNRQQPLSALLRHWQDGSVKQQLIRAVLGYRRDHAALFAAGQYVPLTVHGKLAAHVLAFARHLPAPEDQQGQQGEQGRGEQLALVVCTRLAAHLLGGDGPREQATALVPAPVWGDTRIVLPALGSVTARAALPWRSVLTAGQGSAEPCVGVDGQRGVCLHLADVLGSLPVELLSLGAA